MPRTPVYPAPRKYHIVTGPKYPFPVIFCVILHETAMQEVRIELLAQHPWGRYLRPQRAIPVICWFSNETEYTTRTNRRQQRTYRVNIGGMKKWKQITIIQYKYFWFNYLEVVRIDGVAIHIGSAFNLIRAHCMRLKKNGMILSESFRYKHNNRV